MEIIIQAQTMTVILEGELDHHLAAEIRPVIDERLTAVKPAELVMDFSKVSFMDSSAIGMVLGRYRLASEWNCSVSVTGLSERHKKVMRLAGIGQIAQIRDAQKPGA